MIDTMINMKKTPLHLSAKDVQAMIDKLKDENLSRAEISKRVGAHLASINQQIGKLEKAVSKPMKPPLMVVDKETTQHIAKWLIPRKSLKKQVPLISAYLDLPHRYTTFAAIKYRVRLIRKTLSKKWNSVRFLPAEDDDLKGST